MGVVIINFIITINTGQEEDLEAEGVRQRCLPVPRQRQYLNPSQRRARTFSCSLILRFHSEKLIYIVQMMMVTKMKYIRRVQPISMKTCKILRWLAVGGILRLRLRSAGVVTDLTLLGPAYLSVSKDRGWGGGHSGRI